MKDVSQKDALLRHFAARGWYVQFEVPTFLKGGVQEQQKLITDVDVLALRPGADLRWEAVLGDCKTLKVQSPANRVLWLKGLMQHFSAASGIVILRKKQPIELDHKLLAASLGITLLEESQFPAYDRALVYPDGSASNPLSCAAIAELKDLSRDFQALEPLCGYIYSHAWNEPTYLELLRKVLGHAQTVAKELDHRRPQHLALILDAAGVFAIGLAQCVGTVFTHYLHPKTQDELDYALKVVIWGGRAQYKFIAKLRSDLMAAKGIQAGQSGPLALPSWPTFIQLVRNMLEAPKAAFRIPQLLRLSAMEMLTSQPFLPLHGANDLLALKFAMLTFEYLCHASGIPVEVRSAVTDMFLMRQSDLVHAPPPLGLKSHPTPD